MMVEALQQSRPQHALRQRPREARAVQVGMNAGGTAVLAQGCSCARPVGLCGRTDLKFTKAQLKYEDVMKCLHKGLLWSLQIFSTYRIIKIFLQQI